jgi:hypothetical protein
MVEKMLLGGVEDITPQHAILKAVGRAAWLVN